MRLVPAVLISCALLFAACGDDDAESSDGSSPSEPSATDDASSTTPGDEPEPAGDLTGDLVIVAEDHDDVADVAVALAQLDEDNPDLTTDVTTQPAYTTGPTYTRVCSGEIDAQLVSLESFSLADATDQAACDIEHVEIRYGDVTFTSVFVVYVDDAVVPVAEALDAAMDA